MEEEIYDKIKNGDKEAYETFLLDNMSLVKMIAKKFCGCGLDYDDLVSEGTIGLMHAIENYDITLGYKFSTYASDIIIGFIKNAINFYGGNFSYSKRNRVILLSFKKKINELKEKLDRNPTAEEIAEYLNMNLKLVKKYIRELEQENVLNLNNIVEESKRKEYQDIIRVDDYSLDEIIISEELQKNAQELLKEANLSQFELEIIYYLMGFIDGIPYSMVDVANMYSVTRACIWNRKQAIFEKIIMCKYLDKLFDYAYNSEEVKEYILKLREAYRLKNYAPLNISSYFKIPIFFLKMLIELILTPEEKYLVYLYYTEDLNKINNAYNFSYEELDSINSSIKKIKKAMKFVQKYSEEKEHLKVDETSELIISSLQERLVNTLKLIK